MPKVVGEVAVLVDERMAEWALTQIDIDDITHGQEVKSQKFDLCGHTLWFGLYPRGHGSSQRGKCSVYLASKQAGIIKYVLSMSPSGSSWSAENEFQESGNWGRASFSDIPTMAEFNISVEILAVGSTATNRMGLFALERPLLASEASDVAAARAKLRKERAACQEEVDRLQKELDRAKEATDRLAEKLQAAETDNTMLRNAKAALAKEADDRKSELSRVKEENSRLLSALAEEAADRRNEVDEAKEGHTKLLEKFEAAVAENATLRSSKSVLATQADDRRDEIEAILAERDLLLAKMQAADSEATTLRNEKAALVTESADQRSALEMIAAEKALLLAKVQDAEKETTALRNEKVQLLKRAEEAETISTRDVSSTVTSLGESASQDIMFEPLVNVYDASSEDQTMRFIEIECPGVQETDIGLEELLNGVKITMKKLKSIHEGEVEPVLPIRQHHGTWERDFCFDPSEGKFEIHNPEEIKVKDGVLKLSMKRAKARKWKIGGPSSPVNASIALGFR